MSKKDTVKPHHMGVDSTEFEIEALVAGGRGLGRLEGKAWFVERTVPGDRVRARAWRERAQFVEGELMALVRPSPDRRAAPCPYQAVCGGCPWMVLDESLQRAWKRRVVA